MRYLGSKDKIAKHILPFVLKNRQEGQYYVEPFVGGGNLIQYVKGNRIGNDVNPLPIALLKAIQIGWEPPEVISEHEYIKIKYNQKDYPPELVAFCAFCISFSGIEFSCYCRGYKPNGDERNFVQEQKNYLEKQGKTLKNVLFYNEEYWNFPIPDNSIIYCDPPYEGTIKYKNKFNKEKFCLWLKEKKEEGHTVFISEYSMPEEFILLWEQERKSQVRRKSGIITKERLFTL